MEALQLIMLHIHRAHIKFYELADRGALCVPDAGKILAHLTVF